MSKNSTVIFVQPDKYEQILDNPNNIIIEAQGESPIKLKVIVFPYKRRSKRCCKKSDVNMKPPWRSWIP